MIVLRMAVVILPAVVLQITLFADVRVAGVAPELPLLIAVLAGVVAGSSRGPMVAFVAGLCWDLYLSTPLGLSAISFAVAAYAVGSIEEGLFVDSRIQTVVLVSAGTALALLTYALLGSVVGRQGLLGSDLVKVAAIAAVVNALLSLPTAPMMRWAAR